MKNIQFIIHHTFIRLILQGYHLAGAGGMGWVGGGVKNDPPSLFAKDSHTKLLDLALVIGFIERFVEGVKDLSLIFMSL